MVKPLRTKVKDSTKKTSFRKSMIKGGAIKQEFNQEHMLMSMKKPDEYEDVGKDSIRLSSVKSDNSEISMEAKRLLTHSYDKIDELGMTQYVMLLGEFQKALANDPNESNNLAQTHFSIREGDNFIPLETKKEDKFLEIYGQDIYFFTDPLLNDIDDCIAILYFFYLTLETFKDSTNREEINLYLDLTDVEDIDKSRYDICIRVAEKLVQYCNKILGEREEYNIKVSIKGKEFNYSKVQKKQKGTIFLIRGMSDKSLSSLEELEKMYNKIDIIANGADIFSHEDASCPSNVRCGSKIHKSSNIPRVTIFDNYMNFMNKINTSSKLSLKCFPLKRKDRPFTFKVGQNGTEDQSNSISITQKKTLEGNNLGSLPGIFETLRNNLNTKGEHIVLDPKLGESQKVGRPFKERILRFGDIVFPNVSDWIIDKNTCEGYSNYGSFLIDFLAIMSCPTTNKADSNDKQRTLISFVENDVRQFKTIKEALDNQDKTIRFNFEEIDDDKAVLEQLIDHSNDVLRDCYSEPNYTNETERKLSEYLSKTPGTLIQSPNKIFLFDTKNPNDIQSRERIEPKNAILSRVAKSFKVFVESIGNSDSKVPDEHKIVVDELSGPKFGIMSDASPLFLGKSAGPNGIILLGNKIEEKIGKKNEFKLPKEPYSGTTEYGEYRMNTVFKNKQETLKLVKDFLEFRNLHKDDILKLWLSALKTVVINNPVHQQNEGEGYEYTLKSLYIFHEWCIEKKKKLFGENGDETDKCLEVKSTCQTWMRVLPKDFSTDYVSMRKDYYVAKKDDDKSKYDLRAHNTIPVPHFQTFPYVSNEDKFLDLYNQFYQEKSNTGKYILSVDNFRKGFINLINFFTRSMIGDYGTTYPVKVEVKTGVDSWVKLGTSIPDKDYNGNGFLILDTFEKYLQASAASAASEAENPTYLQVLMKGINGGKRTNKRIRKNKKLSLRKMKGGSKKANQKKLKLKKSRKA